MKCLQRKVFGIKARHTIYRLKAEGVGDKAFIAQHPTPSAFWSVLKLTSQAYKPGSVYSIINLV
jgi:hypothetical protein